MAITKISFKITYRKFHSNITGDNELKQDFDVLTHISIKRTDMSFSIKSYDRPKKGQ